MANETMQKALRRYEKMRDSGVEWIGLVPEEWNILPAKKMFLEVKEKNRQNEYKNPFSFRYGEIVDKRLPGKTDAQLTETLSAYQVVMPNDIVINGLNLNYDFVTQRVAIVHNKGIITSAYLVVRPDTDKIVPRYTMYLLKAFDFRQVFHGIGSGIRKTLKYHDFKELPILCPSEATQNAIVMYLDKKSKYIDEIIADVKTSIEEYKAWKSSIIYEAVTKGLDPTAEMKDSGVDIIGTIPAHWKSSRLKFLCSIMTGNQDTQNAVPDGEYPFYVRSPIVERSNVYTFDGEGILMAGDGAGAGRVFHHAFGKYAIHQRVYCFYNFRETVSDYLFFYMSELFQKEMDKGSAQSTVPSVRMPMITNFVVCLPPISEQNEIVSYLKKRIDSIESIIQAKEELIADLESYKKSLIYEVVTGKRKVV